MARGDSERSYPMQHTYIWTQDRILAQPHTTPMMVMLQTMTGNGIHMSLLRHTPNCPDHRKHPTCTHTMQTLHFGYSLSATKHLASSVNHEPAMPAESRINTDAQQPVSIVRSGLQHARQQE
jgi:hypothetical protein